MLSLSLASLRFTLFPFCLPSWLTRSQMLTFFSLYPYDSCHWLSCPFLLIWNFLAVSAKLCKAPSHHESLIVCFPLCSTSCPPCPRVLCYCFHLFNFILGTHLSCNTQMKKLKLLGEKKSLMKCPAYAIFLVILFILGIFFLSVPIISSTISHTGPSVDSLTCWQVGITPVTCFK